MARHIPIGEPAHDAERQAIRFIVEALPDDYSVYSNAWLVEPRGVVYELDTVIVAPHGLYVVELKSYRGRIIGNDHDWYVPAPITSPLKVNRKTAQVLASELKRESYEAGRRWVEHFVFLSHASDVAITGPASKGRVHTRASLVAALQDARSFAERAARTQPPAVDAHTRDTLHRLLVGADPKHKPPRRIREYELGRTLERTDRYVEHLAVHTLSGAQRILRVYPFGPRADEEERRRLEERCRWEAQVLARIGQHPNVLKADPPFLDEAGICLPLEAFEAISLASWIEKHRHMLAGKQGLEERVRLFECICDALEQAHRHGVVHRLLRPEAVLVEDKPFDAAVRVTGFDLAKQLHSNQTVALTTLHDERLRWAAPEVAQGFSNATPHSDQFGAGALLGLLLANGPLFESTADLLRRHGHLPRLRDLNPGVPHTFDEAVQRMLALRPTDRFPTLVEAREAVRGSITGRGGAAVPRSLDPDDLPEGTRLGTDYEIAYRLGAGGLSTVYAALHLISGTTRALKIAREGPRAREALQAEHRALWGRIDHRNIVKVVDLTAALVPDRFTLVMERVKGEALSKWIAGHPTPDRETLRRYAEDLLAALGHLQEKGLTHKDVKPDNLIVGDEGLTLIDFSLIEEPADSPFVGTARYRDPGLRQWDAAADRYAAALCLFELFTGRHAFDGQAPGPGDRPRLDPTDFDQPGLMGFFERALDPNREARFQSAQAMRSALLDALGVRAESDQQELPTRSASGSPDTPLSASALSETAIAVLRRAGVRTQGELVALKVSQLQAITGLGKKKRKEVIEFRAALERNGVQPAVSAEPARRVLWPALDGDPTDLHRLGLPGALAEALARQGLTTVGRLAGSTRDELTTLSGIGPAKVAQIVDALQGFAERGGAGTGEPATLEALWARASAPFRGHQERIVLETYGLRGTMRTQEELAAELGTTRAEVSRQLGKALDLIDRRVLDPVAEEIRAELEVFGGILRMDDLARGVEDRWPAGSELRPEGMVRLVARLNEARMALVANPDDKASELLLAPGIDLRALEAFLETARGLAGGTDSIVRGGLTAPDAARRSLRNILPEYDLDPLSLATRLLSDVRLTDANELFESPVQAADAIPYVLMRERLPITLDRLWEAIQQAFGDAALMPSREHLAAQVAELRDWRVEGDRILPSGGRSVVARRAEQDALPPELQAAARTPEEIAGDMLRAAAGRRGFRMVVTPPEKHFEIGRSVARALGVELVSFEAELLARMEPAFGTFERAELFLAQRRKLPAEAEALMKELIARHGRHGNTVVLGDTAVFGICEASHLVQRLFDQTAVEDLGFWAVVLPGVIHRRQPLLNEKTPVFQLDGIVVPLRAEIP